MDEIQTSSEAASGVSPSLTELEVNDGTSNQDSLSSSESFTSLPSMEGYQMSVEAQEMTGGSTTIASEDASPDGHQRELPCNGAYSEGAESNGHISMSKHRCQLPAPMFSRSDYSVWSILKQCIGRELSKITMPVIFNEPLSFLQRIVEYMEYSDILKKASESGDPVKRLEYVTAFAVSATASNWERIGKPFNPLLGETYELCREDLGFKIVCEQVSHHPPITAFHGTSKDYTIHGAIHPKLKFWGKSIEVTPKGVVTLTLHRHNEVYCWQNVNCCVHNIIVGKIWIEHYGSMEVNCLTTGLKSLLHFKPSGWFSKELHKVEGYIVQDSKKVKIFYGKWIEALYSHDVEVWEKYGKGGTKEKEELPAPEHATPAGDEKLDNPPPTPIKNSSVDLQLPGQELLWQATPKPHNSAMYYSFTLFAMMLNELTEAHKNILPPTDCRKRPDIRKMEEGDLDGASSEKNRLEEKQRAARKERKKNGEEWKPRWFKSSINPDTKKEDWLFIDNYWNRDWSCCPDIF